MTPPDPWHPEEAALQAYVDGGPSASVEAHLLACVVCRHRVAAGVPEARLSSVRQGLDDRLDALQRTRLERWLMHLGLPEADVRALLAAPAVRAAWCLAVLAAIGLAVMNLRNGRDPDAVFLLLAPLLPLATTALAYAPGLDPALPHIVATPYSTVRLLLARSLAVGVTALLGTGGAALALPDRDVASVAWLLPAVALTLVTLALSPHLGALSASSVVGAVWVSFVVLLHREGTDVVEILSGAGQLVATVLAIAALAVLVQQQKRFDGGGTA